jgi:cell division protein FtsZ
MGDDVRITVIATGFDEVEKKTIPPIETSQLPGGGYRKEDLSTPAFIRKEKSVDRPSVVKMGLIDDSEEADFEIPAFLRKQAD